MVVDSSRRVGVGTAPGSKLDVLEAGSVAQVRIRRDGSVIAGLYLDASGDLTLSSATGKHIRIQDENLWVCSGGSCTTSGKPTSGDTGNIILEKSLYFNNNFRFGQTAVAEVTMFDSTAAAVLIFDEVTP